MDNVSIIGLAGKMGSGKSTLSYSIPSIIEEIVGDKYSTFIYLHIGSPIKALISKMAQIPLVHDTSLCSAYDNIATSEFQIIERKWLDAPKSAIYGMTLRKVLQEIGVMFKGENDAIWVADAFRRMLSEVGVVESAPCVVVLDGIRYKGDVEYINGIPCKKVLVKSVASFETASENGEHISETDLDDVADEFVTVDKETLVNMALLTEWFKNNIIPKI